MLVYVVRDLAWTTGQADLDALDGRRRGGRCLAGCGETEEGKQTESVEVERRGVHAGAALDGWLTAYARQPAAPFFAWLHLYDPHEPYWPPQPFRETFRDALYDGEIAFDDAIVGQLVDRLGELGLLDRTLIAVVGDHGESLGDHGEETHTMFVYDSAVRVPWILWRPGVLKAGVVVRDPVLVTDVAPTLYPAVSAAGRFIYHRICFRFLHL